MVVPAAITFAAVAVLFAVVSVWCMLRSAVLFVRYERVIQKLRNERNAARAHALDAWDIAKHAWEEVHRQPSTQQFGPYRSAGLHSSDDVDLPLGRSLTFYEWLSQQPDCAAPWNKDVDWYAWWLGGYVHLPGREQHALCGRKLGTSAHHVIDAAQRHRVTCRYCLRGVL